MCSTGEYVPARCYVVRMLAALPVTLNIDTASPSNTMCFASWLQLLLSVSPQHIPRNARDGACIRLLFIPSGVGACTQSPTLQLHINLNWSSFAADYQFRSCCNLIQQNPMQGMVVENLEALISNPRCYWCLQLPVSVPSPAATLKGDVPSRNLWTMLTLLPKCQDMATTHGTVGITGAVQQLHQHCAG
jgi:hypothetical protein